MYSDDDEKAEMRDFSKKITQFLADERRNHRIISTANYLRFGGYTWLSIGDFNTMTAYMGVRTGVPQWLGEGDFLMFRRQTGAGDPLILRLATLKILTFLGNRRFTVLPLRLDFC